MRYQTPTAFRTALDERLKAEAATTGLGLSRLRKRVAFELFLRRLVVVAPDRWVLKGALALDFRLDIPTRPTKDIDIEWADTEEAAIEDVARAQELVLDDFFTFVAIKTDALGAADEFSAIRFRVRAELAARTFEQFTIDISFTDPISWEPDMLYTSMFLSFADLEPIALPAIPVTQHLAEKVHAYTRTYGNAGRPSTRPKDLVDILLIATSEPVEASDLRQALVRTFTTRDLQTLPVSLPAPPESWRNPYGQLADEVGVETDVVVAADQARKFLDPVFAEDETGTWNPKRQRWED